MARLSALGAICVLAPIWCTAFGAHPDDPPGAVFQRRMNGVAPGYLLADIELSPGVVDGALTRCICFDLYDCQSFPVTECLEVTFIDGIAESVPIPTNRRVYECVEAKDPLHTLRSIGEVAYDGMTYSAAFAGNPVSGGNWLIHGNLNDDYVIDILDVGLYDFAVANNTEYPTGNTTCSTQPLHADINGDGWVDAIDYDIIAMDNWLEAAKAGCWQLACDCIDPDVDSDGDTIPDCIDRCPGIDDSVFGPDCATAIPAVSHWGLLIMALLVMVGAKLRFALPRKPEAPPADSR